MPAEIERRFLVERLADKHGFPFSSSTSTLIRQGYFDTQGDSTFRVRLYGGKRGEFTIKRGRGISRDESYPSPIPDISFAELALSVSKHQVTKERFKDGRWEIDFFQGPLSGLIIAEIQLKTEDEKFKMPEWIRSAKEVTDSLTNYHLALLASELTENNLPALPFIYSSTQVPLPRIVLTGGPCSGKSGIIDLLRGSMDSIRFVPEVATIVIDQLSIRPSTDSLTKKFQKLVRDTQRLFEVASFQYAVIEGKKAVLFDRGTVDGAAYFPGGIRQFEHIFNTEIKKEFSRYDLVLCLDVPPEDVYNANRSNNPARSEDYRAARDLGDRIAQVWCAHPNFVFISNSGGWDAKVAKVKEAISKAIGS